MDFQLNVFHDQARKDLLDFELKCIEYCQGQFKQGQDDVMKQMIIYCHQQTNGDLRKMKMGQLLNYLIAKRNQLTQTEEKETIPISNNKRQTLPDQSANRHQIQINYERLIRSYQALDSE